MLECMLILSLANVITIKHVQRSSGEHAKGMAAKLARFSQTLTIDHKPEHVLKFSDPIWTLKHG